MTQGSTFKSLINMHVCFMLLLMCNLSRTSNKIDSFYENGIRSLSELPIKKLLQLRSTFAPITSEDSEKVIDKESRTFSLALPLRKTAENPIRRYEEHWEEKGQDSKISKIFHLTVTSLSFLAFGGYLLTLIILAIKKSTANNSNGGSVIVLSNIRRPKRKIAFHDSLDNEYDIEKLYEGMILLSRDYVIYT